MHIIINIYAFFIMKTKEEIVIKTKIDLNCLFDQEMRTNNRLVGYMVGFTKYFQTYISK